MISKNETLIKNRPRFFRYFHYEKGGHDYVNMKIPVYRSSKEYRKYA